MVFSFLVVVLVVKEFEFELGEYCFSCSFFLTRLSFCHFLFRWLRNGEMEVGREASYRFSSSDVNCRLVVECTPVRDDGSKGTALRLESPMIGPGMIGLSLFLFFP